MFLPVWCFSALMTIFITSTRAATYSEPTNFNVTQALSDHNINISQLLPGFNSSRGTQQSSCSAACRALDLIFGSDHVLTPNETVYNDFIGGYWSKIQEDVHPYCVFQPPNKSAVSVVVLISRYTQCPFAAKSGGHAAFQGSSNIAGGITLSLDLLNNIKVSADKKTVSVGPGNTWGRVYTGIAKDNLAVIGGRLSHIGVGGLTLGGGISFFSSIYGWACDNVANYEVVTATGQIINATPGQYSDLYWALRGGGNNFGLVTNFDLNAINLPGSEMWGGTRTFLEPSFPALTNAFHNIIVDSPTDGNAGLWVAWLQINGTKLSSTELWYGKPNGGNATIYKEINAVNPGPISDTTANIKLAQYSEQLQLVNPNGLRESFFCLTVKADVKLANTARDIFYEEIPAVRNVPEMLPAMIYQGITKPQLKAMSRNGGNPLGLNEANGPFYLILIVSRWRDEADDKTVYTMMSKVLTRIKKEAVARGIANDYVYMNYAGVFEDVIRSYGQDNKKRLKSIAAKYDPTQVWQRLQPGYFKLDQAPVVDRNYFSG